MPNPDFKRAHRPEQKEERRRQILRAASELLASEGFDGVSLNAIARSVGVAKSNLYRYFDSREDIFLHLLQADFGGWVTEVERRLAEFAGSDDADGVSTALASACAERPRTCALISVLAAVLEQNASEDSLRSFKYATLGLGLRLGNALHAALPSLSVAQCAVLMQPVYALVAGLWPAKQYTEAMERVMQEPALAPFATSFEEELRRSLHMLILGAQASAREEG